MRGDSMISRDHRGRPPMVERDEFTMYADRNPDLVISKGITSEGELMIFMQYVDEKIRREKIRRTIPNSKLVQGFLTSTSEIRETLERMQLDLSEGTQRV